MTARKAAWTLGIGAGLAAAHWAAGLTSHVHRLRGPFGVIDHIGDPARIALTFDDGPDPLGTPAILEVLAACRAPATFFLSGEQVLRYPELARRVVEEGHEVGLHCHRHAFVPLLTPRQVGADLRRVHDALVRHADATPRHYRPPYGWLSTPAWHVGRRLGCRTVLWSRQGGDWREGATAESITAGLTESLTGGEILLMHDSDRYSAPGCWQQTAEALPAVIEHARAMGMEPSLLP